MVAIHIVYLRPMSVDAVGNVVDKNDPATKIRDVMRGGDMQPRIVPVDGLASSQGWPSLDQYLLAEAASGFVVRHLSATMIVTYPAGS